MITLAFPGLKVYCQITYSVYRDNFKRMGMKLDEKGDFMATIEKKAREEIFPEYLDKMRANGIQVELFDL